MSLRNLRRSDIGNVLQNTSDFAETLEYRPVDGSSRTITASCKQERDYSSVDNTDEQVEVLLVRCSRAKATDASTGDVVGIDRPLVGDRVLLQTETEPRFPFAFTGLIQDQDEYRWTLRFERRAIARQGGRQ